MLRPLLSLPEFWRIVVYVTCMAVFWGVVFGVAPLVWEKASRKWVDEDDA